MCGSTPQQHGQLAHADLGQSALTAAQPLCAPAPVCTEDVNAVATQRLPSGASFLGAQRDTDRYQCSGRMGILAAHARASHSV